MSITMDSRNILHGGNGEAVLILNRKMQTKKQEEMIKNKENFNILLSSIHGGGWDGKEEEENATKITNVENMTRNKRKKEKIMEEGTVMAPREAGMDTGMVIRIMKTQNNNQKLKMTMIIVTTIITMIIIDNINVKIFINKHKY